MNGRRLVAIGLAVVLLNGIVLPAAAITVDVSLGNVIISDTHVTHTPAADEAQMSQEHGGIVEIVQSCSGAVSNTVSVTTSSDITVALNDVNISAESGAAIQVNVSSGAEVTVELNGENTLVGGSKHAALESSGTGGSLIIQDETDAAGSLTATGGDFAAGIGGAYGGNAGDLVITGGDITAKPGQNSAAIGSGYKGTAGDITITGGTIDAQSGSFSTGIGSACRGEVGDITIEGGTITAESGQNNAGIGSGYYGIAGEITINGGSVKAEASEYGAGIGSACYGEVGNITINGGTVEAEGAKMAAGIGSGYYGTNGNIIITGGDVTAYGKYYGAGIGSGYYGEGQDIEITGGTVTAVGGSGAGAGIGSGHWSQSGDITITGGTVNATGSSWGAGIGSGGWGRVGDITITNFSDITAKGGDSAEAIGNGHEGKMGDLIICDATSSDNAETAVERWYYKKGCLWKNGEKMQVLFTILEGETECWDWTECLEDGTLTVMVSRNTVNLRTSAKDVQTLWNWGICRIIVKTAETEVEMDLQKIIEEATAGSIMLKINSKESAFIFE